MLDRLWHFSFSFDLKCSRFRVWVTKLVNGYRFGFCHVRVGETWMANKICSFLVSYCLNVSQLHIEIKPLFFSRVKIILVMQRLHRVCLIPTICRLGCDWSGPTLLTLNVAILIQFRQLMSISCLLEVFDRQKLLLQIFAAQNSIKGWYNIVFDWYALLFFVLNFDNLVYCLLQWTQLRITSCKLPLVNRLIHK